MSSAITTLLTSSTSTSTSSSTSTSTSTNTNPASYKVIGIVLAVVSGFLIGASFVIKKKGLISATAKAGNVKGEGHAYLKSWLWWTGMFIMILGELCNFAAFAFTEAILVTPLGALSVVISAILSSLLLNEKLSFFGWIGCTLCIFGAVILALNAPEQQSVSTIVAFQKFFLAPGFLVWAGICIASSLVLAFWAAKKWGKTNMFVYISICSLIGGLSVSTLQGLGACILTSIRGENQFKHWFIYLLIGFVAITLVTEINYLNKALELFNTSMVTPTYYILFTTATMISSFILYQGLKTSAVSLITMVLGFLVTCLGITLLQMSKVDPKKFEGNLDRRSTMLLTASRNGTAGSEEGELTAIEDPGIDAVRGGFGAVGSIIRVRSASRRLSNASTLAGQTPRFRPGRGQSASAAESMARYSLSDNPMPDDAVDQVSMHSGSLAPPTPTRERAASQLKFDDLNVVHEYDRKGHGAIHSARLHRGNSDISPGMEMIQTESPMSELVPSKPFESFRAGQTAGASYHAGSGMSTAPATDRSFFSKPNLFHHDIAARDRERSGTMASSKHSIHSLMDRFGSGDGPDLRLGKRAVSKDDLRGGQDRSREASRDGTNRLRESSRDSGAATPILRNREISNDDKRGGAHRGVKDYPHLPHKSERTQEHEERTGLVAAGESSDEEVKGDGDMGSGLLSGDSGYAGQEVQLGPEYLHPGGAVPQPTPSPPAFRRLPELPSQGGRAEYPPK